MEKFFCTFAQKSSLKNNYVIVEAKDMDDAHKIMFEIYDQEWAFAYTENRFFPQIKQFGLTEVPLGTKQEFYETKP